MNAIGDVQGPDNGALILLVDDEEIIARSASRTLRRNGYRTIVATDGVAGYACFCQHQQHLHAIVLDMALPGMSGVDLLVRIRQQCPEIRVIAQTGDADALQKMLESHQGIHVDALLLKPYDYAELIQLLKTVAV